MSLNAEKYDLCMYQYNTESQAWNQVLTSMEEQQQKEASNTTIFSTATNLLNYYIYGATSTQEQAQTIPQKISIQTYNVWKDKYYTQERFQAHVQEWQELKPNVICLQEVNGAYMTLLAKDPYVQQNFIISTDPAAYVNYVPMYHWCLFLIQKQFAIIYDAFCLSIPTSTFRRLNVVHLRIKEKTYVSIGVVHCEAFESNTDLRKDQLDTMLQEMSKYKHSILLGDLNLQTAQDEVNIKELTNKYGFADVWQTVHPEKPGYTRDPSNLMIKDDASLERLDRCLLKKQQQLLVPSTCELTGTKQITSISDATVFPSDHYGLQIIFDLK